MIELLAYARIANIGEYLVQHLRQYGQKYPGVATMKVVEGDHGFVSSVPPTEQVYLMNVTLLTWAIVIGAILALIVIDLLTVSKKPHEVMFKEVAGLQESQRMHVLRHTCVSLLIAQGVNIKAIQAWVGHSSISQTLDTYGHLFPGSMSELAEKLDEYALLAASEDFLKMANQGDYLSVEESTFEHMKKECPKCHEGKFLRVFLYGMPSEEPNPDIYVIGGCLIGDNDPTHKCIACGWEGSFNKSSRIDKMK